MSPSDLSSLEWEANGEMSAQDTWDLVKRLAEIEEQDKASNLLHLSSKHSHSKQKKNNIEKLKNMCNENSEKVEKYARKC